MLLQLPFVMAFFFFFPNLFELRGMSFLWMKDLSTYDDFIKFGVTVPFIGNHLSLMCILMTISTLIYTYFNNQISGAAFCTIFPSVMTTTSSANVSAST